MERRTLLQGAGLALATWFLPKHLQAQSSQAPMLVVIFNRGGMDGLTAVQPTRDRRLKKLRPRLMTPDTDLVPLNRHFGLHPALAPFKQLFDAKQLAVIHGVGLPKANRSHFDAQAVMEVATQGRVNGDGWLNRVVGQLPGQAPLMSAISLGEPTLPRALAGRAEALAVEDLDRFTNRRLAKTSDRMAALYGADARDATGASALGALAEIDWRVHANKVSYPRGDFGDALAQTARLIKAEVGLRVACLTAQGWDTHRGQPNAFTRAATPFADGLASFWQDLAAFHDRLLVVSITEFGRTVAENGAAGTDHGRGSVFFALGGGVRGGKIYGDRPTFREKDLADGRDLPVVLDYRDVMADAARWLDVSPVKAGLGEGRVGMLG